LFQTESNFSWRVGDEIAFKRRRRNSALLEVIERRGVRPVLLVLLLSSRMGATRWLLCLGIRKHECNFFFGAS